MTYAVSMPKELFPEISEVIKKKKLASSFTLCYEMNKNVSKKKKQK